jgi:hypothetical protein
MFYDTVAVPFIKFITLIERENCIGSWRGNRRERDHWGSLGVDG